MRGARANIEVLVRFRETIYWVQLLAMLFESKKSGWPHTSYTSVNILAEWKPVEELKQLKTIDILPEPFFLQVHHGPPGVCCYVFLTEPISES